MLGNKVGKMQRNENRKIKIINHFILKLLFNPRG